MDHLVPKHGTDEWKASESNVDSHKHKFCWACRHGPMNMTEKFCLNPKCGIRQPVLTTDCVGILRLDGANYSGKQSVAGDVAAGKDTFDYDVMYMRVEGYSFSACKAGPRLLRDGMPMCHLEFVQSMLRFRQLSLEHCLCLGGLFCPCM